MKKLLYILSTLLPIGILAQDPFVSNTLSVGENTIIINHSTVVTGTFGNNGAIMPPSSGNVATAALWFFNFPPSLKPLAKASPEDYFSNPSATTYVDVIIYDGTAEDESAGYIVFILPKAGVSVPASFNSEFMINVQGMELGEDFPFSIQMARGTPPVVNDNDLNDLGSGNLSVTTNPLPVRLLSFHAKAENCSNNLNWKVENEHNFSHYEIQRYTISLGYETIAKIEATNAGNYQFADINNKTASAKYRLKMIDLDGKSTYSQEILLQSNCNNSSIKVLPTITKSDIKIFGLASGQKVEVLNSIGQKLLSSTAVTANMDISLQKYQAGIYIITIADTNGKVISTQKVIKE